MQNDHLEKELKNLKNEVKERIPEVLKKIFNPKKNIEKRIQLAKVFSLTLEHIRKMPEEELLEVGKNSKPLLMDRKQFDRDALTGLFGRSIFEKEMVRLSAEKYQPVGILIFDLNNLKPTNDTFGHTTGDKLIRTTADVLTQACYSDDIICRIGGDEFAILMPNAEDEKIKQYYIEIMKKVEEYNKNNPDLKLSLSVGYAIKTNEEEMADLFNRADKRMYVEKIKAKTSSAHT